MIDINHNLYHIMSNSNITMSKLRAILLSYKEDISSRTTAANLSISDKTVRNYIKQFKTFNMSIDDLLALDDYELEKKFFVGSSAVTDNRFEFLKERLDQLKQEWAMRRKTHVTKLLLWEEYCEDCKNNGKEPYQYTQFVYHFNKYINVPEATLTYVFKENKEAGKYLFVDFAGDKMECIDQESGEIIEYQLFVGIYPFSNALFVMPVRTQTVDDYIYCLDCCVRQMAVPKIIICDNLKAAVIQASRYTPKFNTVFEDFCAHYNIIPVAARPFTPTEKSEVERFVQVTYNHICARLRKYTFFSYNELCDGIKAELKKFMQSRPKGSDMTREEIFITLEKPYCKDLRKEPFEVIRQKTLRVDNDSCIHPVFDELRYSFSVPYKHIGKLVTFKYSRSHVTILDNHEIIATHEIKGKQRYYITPEHMPSYYGKYVNRSPEMYIQEARERSCDNLVQLITKIFENVNIPEAMYKKVEYLLHLQKVTEDKLFSLACEIALKLDKASNVKFIENLINSKCVGYAMMQDGVTFPPQEHENVRGSEYYQQIMDFEY